MKQLLAFGLLSFLMLCGFMTRATTALADTGNQACNGTPNPFRTSGAVCGSASRYGSDDDDVDLSFARSAADQARNNNLRIASGVICNNCESGPFQGLQCSVSVTLGLGSDIGSSETHQTNPENPSQTGWAVTHCWTGSYTVTCANCPT